MLWTTRKKAQSKFVFHNKGKKLVSLQVLKAIILSSLQKALQKFWFHINRWPQRFFFFSYKKQWDVHNSWECLTAEIVISCEKQLNVDFSSMQKYRDVDIMHLKITKLNMLIIIRLMNNLEKKVTVKCWFHINTKKRKRCWFHALKKH